MKLIIVESPTKARTLTKFLGSDYVISATMGHLRDLPERNLGVVILNEVKDLEILRLMPQNDTYTFTPQYELVSKKKETITKLKALAKKADQIILATDPDREGEAIAWHVAEILGKREIRSGKRDTETRSEKSRVQNISLPYLTSHITRPASSFIRIVFHEITESAIKEALANPGQIEMNLVWAQQARRILDRLVGYKLSPVLWRKIRRGLSAGRVQSVTVRLIVEREREIKAFKAEEYWSIEAELNNVGAIHESPEPTRAHRDAPLQNSFLATLVSVNEKKAEIHTKAEADQLVVQLEKCEYQVKNVETSELRKYPYPPFTTSTLQQAASNLFGWAAKQTMRVAQHLYEEGLITYHRTDSMNLASQAVTMCRDFIKKEYGINYLPDLPKVYKTKSKVAQEAHEAIRVTKLEVRSEKLERDEERLYDLIWKRFVACQMNEAVFEQTKVEISADPVILRHQPKDLVGDSSQAQNDKIIYLFRALGSKLKFDGWRRLYGDLSNESNLTNETNLLSLLTVGELLNLLKLLPSQHFTESPARFTEASLIKALEEKGIGRPSTYAPTISTIQERQYVEKLEKKFSPTALGETVNDFLVKNFPKELDYEFTARMEDDLDEIANGKKQWQPVLSEFYGPFLKKVDEVSQDAPRSQVPVEKTNEKCEKCGGEMVIRLGRFGKFIACANFPKCKNTKPLVVKTDLKCPKCNGEIVMRKTKRGRHFYGCGNYPKCDFAAWKKEEILNPASKGVPLQS